MLGVNMNALHPLIILKLQIGLEITSLSKRAIE